MRRFIARVLAAFGWLFVVVAPLCVLGSAYLAFWIQKPLAEQLGKALSLTSLVPAALLLTLGGLLLTKSRELVDAEEKRSLFYLDSCVLAYEEARSLLSDGNNDRATWIEAARALRHAKVLSENVSIDAHRRVLELHQLKYRGFFQVALAERSAAFFYGAKDGSTPIADAAAASSAPIERAGRTVTSTLKRLDERSLHAVWEAAQWPSDYQDPLDVKFSEKEQGSLLVLYPGLHEYIGHVETFHSASGKLFRRDKDENS